MNKHTVIIFCKRSQESGNVDGRANAMVCYVYESNSFTIKADAKSKANFLSVKDPSI